MTISPRQYASEADRAAVLDLLRAGLMAAEAGQRLGYYAHPGDAHWWLDYLNHDDPQHEQLQLWEQDGALVAWTLLSVGFRAADVFVRPEFYDSDLLPWLWGWAADHLRALLPAGQAARVVEVAEDDVVLQTILAGLGFRPRAGEGYISLECRLAAPRAAAEPPAGFTVRRLRGEADMETRARASHAAFGSTWPLERYIERYRRFMHSPAYGAAYDLAAVEESSGTVAAFALAWPDAATGLGLFEPVGTHPAYQRRGLARALLTFGLNEMWAAGMRAVRINVEAGNEPAKALYAALGFTPARRLLIYETETTAHAAGSGD